MKKASFAKKMVRLFGYTREQAITEIAAVDGITQEEARTAYDHALIELHARQLAARTRSEMEKLAIRDAKRYLETGRFIENFNKAAAKRYRSYKNKFWAVLENAEIEIIYDESGFGSGAGIAKLQTNNR